MHADCAAVQFALNHLHIALERWQTVNPDSNDRAQKIRRALMSAVMSEANGRFNRGKKNR